jgi:hypothetical protein
LPDQATLVPDRPEPGAIVQVRSRRYLVEDVEPPRDTTWEQTLVDLC